MSDDAVTPRPVTDTTTPYTCIHCQQQFKNWKALVSHLRDCQMRNLKRVFDIGPYRFTLTLNPRKKQMIALRTLAQRYPDRYQVFLGAVLYLKEAGQLRDFSLEKIKEGGDGEEFTDEE